MSGLPADPSRRGLRRFLSGVMVVLGAMATYWAFQPEGPDAFGRRGAFGDLLMSWKVGPVSPLVLLLGGYLMVEAVRMWRRAN